VHVYQGKSVRVTPLVPFVRSSSAAGGAQQSQAVAQVISLLFVEDHASYRQALRAVMATEHDLCVVAEVETPEEAGASAARSHPVVALVDLDLPYGDGVDAIAEIRASSPATSCVVLSALTDDAELGCGGTMARWIDANGYRSGGFYRELCIERGEDRGAWVTEL
jgi:CheY-like chemotaxis protein